MDKTTFTIIFVDDMLVNIKVPNRFFMGSNTKITELLDKLKQIPEYKNVTEIKSEMYYDSKPESKVASVDAIERIKTHENNNIDMIVSDLNMSPKDGCDVVKEATKFNIPIYMTSDSLSTFFKDETNSCKTIQNAENELVRGFNDCCNLPNVFGIHKCGKLSIPDITPLFDKFIEYKLKLSNDNTNETKLKQTINENKLVQNNIESGQTPVKNDESLVPIKTTDSLVPIKTKESWISKMEKMFSNSSKKVIPVNTGGKNKKNNTKKKNTKKKNTKKNNKHK